MQLIDNYKKYKHFIDENPEYLDIILKYPEYSYLRDAYPAHTMENQIRKIKNLEGNL